MGAGGCVPAAQLGDAVRRRSRTCPPADAQPGDLIFYNSPISHVGIYLGGGQYVHAPATGDVVKVSSVNWNKVTAVGRPG